MMGNPNDGNFFLKLAGQGRRKTQVRIPPPPVIGTLCWRAKLRISSLPGGKLTVGVRGHHHLVIPRVQVDARELQGDGLGHAGHQWDGGHRRWVGRRHDQRAASCLWQPSVRPMGAGVVRPGAGKSIPPTTTNEVSRTVVQPLGALGSDGMENAFPNATAVHPAATFGQDQWLHR